MEAKFFGRNQRDIVFIHYHLYAGWRTALCLLSERYVPGVFWNDIFCHVEIIQEKFGMRPFAPELKPSQTFDWAEEYKYPTVVLDQIHHLFAPGASPACRQSGLCRRHTLDTPCDHDPPV